MNCFKKMVLLVMLILVSACGKMNSSVDKWIASPDGNTEVLFHLTEEGRPTYKVMFGDDKIIDESFLGFTLKDGKALKDNFKILNSARTTFKFKALMKGTTLLIIRKYFRFELEAEYTFRINIS